MPIISNFPVGGGGTSGGGLALGACTGITTLASSGKVYVKWTDPDDLVVAGSTLASWGGTLLVRKAGSMPVSRRDGTTVLDSKTKNAYQNTYFCDSGLTDGVTYYYKFFSYTTTSTYTESDDNGFSITPNPVALGDVSGMSAVAAGNGKLAIKWTDPAATVVSDGITLATWEKTTVVVKEGSYATEPDDADAAFTYTSTTRNAHTTAALTATGLTNGTTYYISFFPTSTDGAANASTDNRISAIANRMTIAVVPSQSGTLTYSGTAQSPSWTGYDATKMSLAVTAQTTAGTYTAEFTPLDDYMWADGSIDAETVEWTIGKAAGSLSIAPTTITLDADNPTATITVTRAGDGAITATSNATGVATVSVSGNTVTVNSVNETTGVATITIKVAAGTNHLAPADKTCAVTAQFLPAQGTPLNNCTWEEISQIAAEGLGDTYFDVGDCKGVLVNGTVGTFAINATYYVYILGFNHNGAANAIDFGGFKTAASGGVDVCLTDSNYNTYKTDGTKMFNMNHWGNYNHGGWKGCDARYDILGSTDKQPSGYGAAAAAGRVGYDASTTCATTPVANTLMAALPLELRTYMKPMTIYTDSVGNSSNVAANVTTSVDYLPLLAEFEIFGTRSQANQYEQNSQKQYAYYSGGNAKIKYRQSATTTAAFWWERSPYYNTATGFCIVYADGSANTGSACYSYGLAPAFRI